jgi:hypothetical protein
MCAGAERMSMYVWLTNTKLGISRLGSRGLIYIFFSLERKIMDYIFGCQNLNFNHFHLKIYIYKKNSIDL